MKLTGMRRYGRIGALVILCGGLLSAMGGCPIDSDALATDVVQAALLSVTNSLVEALSTYLAGT
jgi:hypothetical protein